MAQLNWYTSSYSNQTECVEVAIAGEVVAVRDSKDRAAGYFKVCFKFIVPVLLAFILFCQLIDFFGLKIPGLS